MTLSRRTFLLTASAAALAPALPMLPVAEAVAATAPKLPKLAFAVGTPGEFDWQSIFARTAEEAYRIWRGEQGFDDEWDEDSGEPSPEFDPDYVQRVPAWDGLKATTPADWFRAGLGHTCSRCGEESHSESGARIVGEDVVCESCLTIADLAVCDSEQAIEQLAERIAINDGDAAGVQAILEKQGHWSAISPDLWAKALEESKSL